MVEKTVSSTELAKIRTALANQRTYLAYTRTGFAIVALAIKTRSHIVIAVGIILIAIGVYQYYVIAKQIEDNEIALPNKEVPLIFTVAGIMAVYYYFS